MINKLCNVATDRVILSFAPKTIFYDVLKKIGIYHYYSSYRTVLFVTIISIGELFPGKSKTTRAYLHPEETVIRSLKQSGFEVRRSSMTSTKFYFSRLLEAVRVKAS